MRATKAGSGDVRIAMFALLYRMLLCEACIIIKLAVFRGFSGDDTSMSVEKSNYASSQAVSKVFIHWVPLYL